MLELNPTKIPAVNLDFVSIQCDVNGTVTVGDSKKQGKKVKGYELIEEVASIILDKWDETCKEDISYADYIQKIRFPENQEKQDKKIGKFIHFLKKKGHFSYPKALEMYQSLAERYLDPKTEQVKFDLFPSILRFITQVSRTCSYTLTLRSFGIDGPAIVKEFSKTGIEIKHRAVFVQEGLTLDGEKTVTAKTEIFKKMKEAHIQGKDLYKNWDDHQREAAAGKLVYCVKDGHWEGKNVVSIFLDDNLSKRPKGQEKQEIPADPHEKDNIAFPVDIYDRPTSWDSRGVIGIRVNTIKAALQDDYIIKKVNKELIKRGFSPLKVT